VRALENIVALLSSVIGPLRIQLCPLRLRRASQGVLQSFSSDDQSVLLVVPTNVRATFAYFLRLSRPYLMHALHSGFVSSCSRVVLFIVELLGVRQTVALLASMEDCPLLWEFAEWYVTFRCVNVDLPSPDLVICIWQVESFRAFRPLTMEPREGLKIFTQNLRSSPLPADRVLDFLKVSLKCSYHVNLAI